MPAFAHESLKLACLSTSPGMLMTMLEKKLPCPLALGFFHIIAFLKQKPSVRVLKVT